MASAVSDPPPANGPSRMATPGDELHRVSDLRVIIEGGQERRQYEQPKSVPFSAEILLFEKLVLECR